MPVKCPRCGAENPDGAAACRACRSAIGPARPGPAPATSMPFQGLARRAVEQSALSPALAARGIELDFSAAGVRCLDIAFDATFGTEGAAPGREDWLPPQEMLAVMMECGSYFGEVCRRLTGGTWQTAGDKAEDLVRASVEGGGRRVFPIGQAYARIKNGAKDGFYAALQRFAETDLERCKPWGAGYLRQARLMLRRGTLPVHERGQLAMELCLTAAFYDPALAKEAHDLNLEILKLPKPPSPAPPEPTSGPPPVAPEAAAQALEWNEKASQAFREGRQEDMVACLQQALRLDPSRPQYWRGLGIALTELRRHEEAEAVLMQACSLGRDDAANWKRLAVVKLRLKKYDHAADCWRRVTELAPEDPVSWHWRGITANYAGRFDDAADSLGKCLELAPGDPEVLLEKIVTMDKAGRKMEAMVLATAVLAVTENVETLRKKPLKDYDYIMGREMSLELAKLLLEKLG